MSDFADIKAIKSFASLVRYLRTHLDWPVDEDDAVDLTFDYTAEELGLGEQAAVKIREIKQIRPLVDGQPWGIFWLDFEPKRLPVVVMRRVLGALIQKKRASRQTRQATWQLHDLMFISATGQGSERGLGFAHFRENVDGQPQLRTFSWDANERHFYYIEKINLEALRWPANPADTAAWREQWAAAFTAGHREVITTAQALATQMALLAAATRDLVQEVYALEKPRGPLHKLYEAFKRVLIHDLSVEDFADMYAQTVAYGLFSAAATPHTGAFTLKNAVALIPNTNPFLRELFAECLKLGAGGRHEIDLDELGVGALMDLLSRANMEAIQRDFGRQTRGADPVIHFYESFLREYDADKKVERGVFYTPDPVVSFIVRSVDRLLKTEFGCANGFGDTSTMQWQGETVPRVQVLDPATGTGTFLKYVIDQIHTNFTEKHARLSAAERKRRWNEYVPKHLLPRLYGFELMMAPYAVAHMKLGLALKQTEYDFGAEERLRVYLTNTLQTADEIPRVDTPFLAHEAEQANAVKTERPIMVVIGNPPYAGHSANASKNPDGTLNFIGRLLRDYYFVDGQPLGEQNPKYLLDDYVKFIRFAQWRIESTNAGIVAMITNNGYLDNPTFRGMRYQLLQAFSEIYVLNLHGSLKKQEHGPDGSKDENVFDIQQGVAICVMVRRPGSSHRATLHHADIYGRQDTKYEQLMLSDLSSIGWRVFSPSSPFYLFVPQDEDVASEYKQYWSVTDIMPVTTTGVKTHRDHFAVDFDQDVLDQRIRDFRDSRLPDSVIRDKYALPDTRDWKLPGRRRSLRKDEDWNVNYSAYLYRPLDLRYVYFHADVVELPRHEIMGHLLAGENYALGIGRQGLAVSEDKWDLVTCTKNPIDTNVFRRGGVQVFPVYLYPEGINAPQPTLVVDDTGIGHGQSKANLQPSFINLLSQLVGLKFVDHGRGDLIATLGPDSVFHYIYAVLHSPTYRQRYASLLKIDFPRVPLTRDQALFRALVEKGRELVSLHLMGAHRPRQPMTSFKGRGEHKVAAGYPKYDDGTVWINEDQGFHGVPEDVWQFMVGGYQVAHKWLKDRRGRALSTKDQAHYPKVITALAETIRIMVEIDEAIPSWPIE